MILDDSFLPVGSAVPPIGRSDVLRLGAFQERSVVAGPGVRSVLWVAGCHRRCPGCIKPELFSFDSGWDIGVDELYAKLMAVSGVDGVTFSGGEPFEQPSTLGLLASRLRKAGRNVTVYTGYRLEWLREHTSARYTELLDNIDILIDGEYRENETAAGRWRGSANQRLIPMTLIGRLLLDAASGAEDRMREVQIVVDEEGLRLTGCPAPGLLEQITPHLAARGVTLRPIIGGRSME
jgi:anaerobic ribonucleoside-triphosphate reductase activating protein